VGHFQRALEIDSQSALTYSGLALCSVLMGTGEYGLRAPSEMMEKAKAAALKALNIDDSIAEEY